MLLAVFVFLIAHFQIPEGGEYLTMSTDTSREDTVHHIDTTSDPLDEILWSPDSHEIVRLIRRQ